MTTSPLLRNVAPNTYAYYYDQEIVANCHDEDPSQTARDIVYSTKVTTVAQFLQHMSELKWDDRPYFNALRRLARSENIM